MSLIKYLSTGKDGLPNTKTRCEVICDKCNSQFIRNFTTRERHIHDLEIGGDYCIGCIQMLPAKRKKMSQSIKQMTSSDPAWKRRNSESKKGKINIGEKNGMKSLEARKKASISRKKMFKDPVNRKKAAVYTAEAWADGKYDGVKVGRCKWLDFEKKDGTIAKCQGTWELAYAKWLDDNDIEFVSHRGRVEYKQFGVTKSYYPDFYLIASDVYIDVKNKYHFSLNEEKFNLIRMQNSNITIKLLFREDLERMGVL